MSGEWKPARSDAGAFEWRHEPIGDLADYASLGSSFVTSLVCDIKRLAGVGVLAEVSIASPLMKDYDRLEHPREWLQFDVSKWVRIGAFIQGRRVGGAIAAMDTPGVDMLEGRSDLAVLWDLRVAASVRRAGVGSGLFRAAEAWAVSRGCTELKVETQHVNLAACRLYERMGCSLAQLNPGVYEMLPEEVQLIWRKKIGV